MKIRTLLFGMAAAGGVTAASMPVAHASFPVGVWVKVSKITYEPDQANATAVRVDGAFMMYGGSGYSNPAKGSVYYTCPAGQEKVCQMEWADLAANVSQPMDTCKGFGAQDKPTGTFYPEGSSPGAPDTYPIAMGVVGGFSFCQTILKYLEDGAGGAGGTAGAGGTSGAGGDAGSGGSTAGTGGASGGSGGTAGAAGGTSGAGGASAGSGGSSAGSGGSSAGSGGAAAGAGGSSAGSGGASAGASGSSGASAGGSGTAGAGAGGSAGASAGSGGASAGSSGAAGASAGSGGTAGGAGTAGTAGSAGKGGGSAGKGGSGTGTGGTGAGGSTSGLGGKPGLGTGAGGSGTAGSDAAAGADAADAEDDGGCSCSAVGDRPSVLAGLPLLGLAIAWAARRRRARLSPRRRLRCRWSSPPRWRPRVRGCFATRGATRCPRSSPSCTARRCWRARACSATRG